MDRKTILIVVVFALLIGGWALVNYVILPKPELQGLEVLAGEVVVPRASKEQEQTAKSPVFVVKGDMAREPLSLRLTTANVEQVELFVNDEPLGEAYSGDALRGPIRIAKSLNALVARHGQGTDGVRLAVVCRGRGGQTPRGSFVILRERAPQSRPSAGSQPARSQPSDQQPVPPPSESTQPRPRPATGGRRLWSAGADDEQNMAWHRGRGNWLLLGSYDKRDKDGKLLYPIAVEFDPRGASIFTLKLTEYKDRVDPTIWVPFGEKPPDPVPYSLLNPLRPTAKAQVNSSVLRKIELLRSEERYDEVTDVTETVFEQVHNAVALGRKNWRIDPDKDVRYVDGVPVEISFHADVTMRPPPPATRPATGEPATRPAVPPVTVLTVTKTYWIDPGGYEVFCRVGVQNRLSRPAARELGLPDKLYVRLVHTGGVGVPSGMYSARYPRQMVFGRLEGGKDVKEGSFSGKPEKELMRASVVGFCFPGCAGGGEQQFTPFAEAEREMITSRGGARDERDYNAVTLPLGSDVRWVSVINKYFAAVWIPRYEKPPKDKGEPERWPLTHPKSGESWLASVRAVGVREAADSVGANYGVEFTTDELALGYVGSTEKKIPQSRAVVFSIMGLPKKNDLFSRYGGVNLQAVRKVQRGCPCAIPGLDLLFAYILKGLSYVTLGNYGLAIILLVVVIRVLFFPLSRKGQLSMMKMQKLAPKIEELKKKYKDDRQALQQAQMTLMREHGVSPFGSCLPMFIQIPIWVALWMSLNSAIELRHAAFLPFWITDLAAPDALISWRNGQDIPLLNMFWGGQKVYGFNLLPLLMAVVMFAQQRMAPRPDSETDQQAQQRKMMQWMMLIFPIWLYTAPSGLTLYIMASTGIGLIETKYIRKHLKDLEDRGELFKRKEGKGWFGRMVERAQRLHDVGGKGGGPSKGSGRSGSRRDWRSGSRGGRRQ
jgi:YidC/Oxa1 family membrane protein insertase